MKCWLIWQSRRKFRLKSSIAIQPPMRRLLCITYVSSSKKWENDGIDCKIIYPKYKGIPTSMWELISIARVPPTRRIRYCCKTLKETTGYSCMIATGVRWAESSARLKSRSQFEAITLNKKNKMLLSDNDDKRQLFETCTLKARRVVNPIIDWTDDDIWEYAKSEKLCLNSLYDCGFKRVGCVGCPLANSKSRQVEFAMFPKYKDLYI